MNRTLRLIPRLIAIFVRTKFEYPGAMLLACFSQATSYGAMYTAIALIVTRFGIPGD